MGIETRPASRQWTCYAFAHAILPWCYVAVAVSDVRCLAVRRRGSFVSRSLRARSFLTGKRFGDVGAYERINGRVYFSVAVANPHNRRIVDLENAVNLKDGEVEFSSDFIAIRPKDPHKSNGSLLLEIPNRGAGRIIALVDGGNWDVANDAGDAWLLRNGYTVVTLGWQWDATGQDALRLYAPIARENGKTITGLLRGDLMPSKAMAEIPLGHLIVGKIGGIEYPVAAPDDRATYSLSATHGMQSAQSFRDRNGGSRKLLTGSLYRATGTSI